MSAQTFEADVAIIGGGVVGASLAAALAQGGVDVTLVEKSGPPKIWNAQDEDLRIFAIAPGSAAFLQSIGAWESVTARRACAYRAMRVWESDPAQALAFDAGELRAPQLGHIVEHGLLLDAITQRLDGVRVLRGAGLAQASFDELRASAILTDGTVLRARLLIAADGADSHLRGLAGIDTVGWNYAQQAIVSNVVTARPHAHTAWQRFLPTGPLAFLPLADGRSSIVWSSTAADELMTLGDAEFLARLTQASQSVLGDVTQCTRRLVFPLRMQHAKEYVRPRLALVGDSAHVVHPLAGQGVNLGFADAQALAAEVCAARASGRDPGSLRLLKRYERARRADNLDMIAVTDGLYRLFGIQSEGLQRLLQAGLGLVNRVPLAKQTLMRRAIGIHP